MRSVTRRLGIHKNKLPGIIHLRCNLRAERRGNTEAHAEGEQSYRDSSPVHLRKGKAVHLERLTHPSRGGGTSLRGTGANEEL